MNHGLARRVVALLILAVLACGAAPAKSAASHAATKLALPRAKPFDAPLARSPLTPPLVVTGGFGEYRVGHFHAGYDFGTHKKVGQPVFAPLAGHVERIRASGVGYGRSIYLRTRDGRLIQFGHLDAYAEPMASWVRAIQDSSGIYEQDLWPEASRFPIKLGQRIAWTGESGAGGPHMHFEIRRGDMAYQPELAGLKVRDDRAPSLVSLTLEPLDDTSYVEGSAGPVTRTLGARPETLRVIGRVRAIVGARDGAWSGVDRMVPWLTRMEWGNQWVECRMDSISWATDMSEGDYVYDAGRVVGDKGIVLWASRGFRPRFIRSSAPLHEEAGTIQVRAGDAPLAVKLMARDVSGHVAKRAVLLRPVSRPGTDEESAKMDAELSTVAVLPDGFVRYRARESPGSVELTPWIVRMASKVPGVFLTREESSEKTIGVVPPPPVGHRWELPYAARFDSSYYFERGWPARPPKPPAADPELVGVVTSLRFGPESLPLRGSLKLKTPASGKPHAAIYRRDEDGWSWVGDHQENGSYVVESRRLGWFAEFQDTLAPRIQIRPAPAHAIPGPYSRWQLEAGITEKGSGVDARACYFVVDGRKVAVEWDPEADVLRWRPLSPPKSGAHRFDVIAADKAGNQSVRSGTFVLD